MRIIYIQPVTRNTGVRAAADGKVETEKSLGSIARGPMLTKQVKARPQLHGRLWLRKMIGMIRLHCTLTSFSA